MYDKIKKKKKKGIVISIVLASSAIIVNWCYFILSNQVVITT